MNSNQKAFFELLKAGLWGDGNPEIRIDGITDWQEVYQLAQEQSVQGIVLQGIEAVQGAWLKVHGSPLVPRILLLQWIGEVRVIEQQNRDMNEFVAKLIAQLRANDIYAILVKGQGVAQCYERPLWRSSGDVDLLLSGENYEKAKKVLMPLATDAEQEFTHFKHLGMTIDGFAVELHGTLHTRLSARVDNVVDEVQRDVFCGGNVRSVEFKSSSDSRIQVFLPAPNEDVIFVFTHILHHFFFEGIGLRQICDWCRLLWTYKDSLNHKLLETRLRKAGLMTEWKAFGALAIEYLGYPKDSMPFLNSSNIQEFKKFRRKADKICKFVLEVGNFGHKQRRDYSGMSYITRKFISFWGRLGDMFRHFKVFPWDSIRFMGGILRSGLHAAMRGE